MPFHLALGAAIGDVLRPIGGAIVQAIPQVLGQVATGIFGQREPTGIVAGPTTSAFRSQQPIVFAGGGLASATPQAGGVQMAGLFDLTIPEFLGGAPAVMARRGGIAMGGVAPGFFHATPTGRVLPNSLTLATDPLGNLAFFVHAGKPTHFSKIGKFPRARHHHGHPVHHRRRRHPR